MSATTALAAAPRQPRWQPRIRLAFNLSWDASVNNAPAGFMTDVIAAASYLASQFSDPVTLNIRVGYGEVAGILVQARSARASPT